MLLPGFFYAGLSGNFQHIVIAKLIYCVMYRAGQVLAFILLGVCTMV